MNLLTGEVTLESKGRAYTLRLDFNAMCSLEGYFSTPDRMMTFPMIVEAVKAQSFTHLRGVVWAALRRHHPDLTVDDAGDIVWGAGGLAGLQTQLQALMTSANPDPADLAALKVEEKAKRPSEAPANSRRISRPGTGGASTSPPAVAG
jgi:hypothetical protein